MLKSQFECTSIRKYIPLTDGINLKISANTAAITIKALIDFTNHLGLESVKSVIAGTYELKD